MEVKPLCPACEGRAISRRDGQPLRPMTLQEYAFDHDACPFCTQGQKEAKLMAEAREELSKAIMIKTS